MVAQIEEEAPGINIPEGSTQQEFFWDQRRYLCWIGGRGSSKTVSAVLRLIGMISRGEIAAGDRILVFGPSYPQMRKGTLVTFDEWFDRTGWVQDKINGNEPERRLVNDIIIYFRNASNPDQTRGHEVRLVWLDEAAQMDEQVFTLANAALRQRRRDGTHPPYQLICTTTPRGRNWLYRRFKDPASRFSQEQMGYYETTTLDAIKYGFLPASYIDEMGYVEGSEMWKQEIEGQFVTWGGLVFHAFHPVRHCPEPFILPEFKTVYGGIDIGLTAPTALLLTGITPQGKMYTFKEFYKRRCLPHEWMKVAAEWTKEHNVRRWYVDSAADQELRAMKGAGLPAYPSMKAKDAAGTAVNYINSKFQRDELLIDRTACPFLVSEIETYQHKEISSGDSATFLDTVKPNQPDHACFVAGTLVITERGEIPIEQVVVGDFALTRRGFRRVNASGLTQQAAQVYALKLNNGVTITATGDHLFWTQGRGWVRLLGLTPSDTLLAWHDQNPEPSTASSSGVTRTPARGLTATTSRREAVTGGGASDGSMRKSGSRTMALFLRSMPFTISTSIPSITSELTSSASQGGSTLLSMQHAGSSRRLHSTTSNASALSQRNGTHLPRGEHGIAPTGARPSQPVSRALTSVISAAKRLIHWGGSPPRIGSVPTTAKLHGDELPVWTTSGGSASSAEQSLSSIATSPYELAPVRVERVSPVAGKHPVYSLSVDQVPEFYARGVLVHNCDSWRYHVLPLASAGAAQQYGRSLEFAIGG